MTWKNFKITNYISDFRICPLYLDGMYVGIFSKDIDVIPKFENFGKEKMNNCKIWHLKKITAKFYDSLTSFGLAS